jgi:hypothetical protein
MDEWWARILAGGELSADEHAQLAERLMAFSERTAQANPERSYACVRDDTERAMAHALIAMAKLGTEKSAPADGCR